MYLITQWLEDRNGEMQFIMESINTTFISASMKLFSELDPWFVVVYMRDPT